MNWGAVGASGEIAGAVAVFCSLAYLAVQIRSESQESRAATMLRQNWFISPSHSRTVIDARRFDYDHLRPHRSLDQRTPNEVLKQQEIRADLSPDVLWLEGERSPVLRLHLQASYQKRQLAWPMIGHPAYAYPSPIGFGSPAPRLTPVCRGG